jgi:hypothetical protein
MTYIQYIPQSCRKEGEKKCLLTPQQQYPSTVQQCNITVDVKIQTGSSTLISVVFCLSILLERHEKEWPLDQDLFKKKARTSRVLQSYVSGGDIAMLLLLHLVLLLW